MNDGEAHAACAGLEEEFGEPEQDPQPQGGPQAPIRPAPVKPAPVKPEPAAGRVKPEPVDVIELD